MDFTELRHLAEQIETECGKAIIGKGEQIRLVLTSLFAGGHVLIDDIPGVGKTTLVKALSAVLGCGMVRVQFTPDLLPSDIVGMNIYSQKTGEMVFTPGPIMTNILLADEISPDTCRLWDVNTNEKMDKDRFRRDMGKVIEAYQEVFRRISE